MYETLVSTDIVDSVEDLASNDTYVAAVLADLAGMTQLLKEVANSRAVGSWLSYDDLIQLVTRAIDTPVTGFAVVYGISDNDRGPVDNSKARFLGCRPKDNAE